MWLFHPLGFCSIVANTKDPRTLLTRGRFQGDLQRLFPGARVETTPERDYRFRAIVTREAVGVRLAELAASITYPNFKDAAPENRHRPYMDVWTIMYREQLNRAPRRRGRRRGKRSRYGDLFVVQDRPRYLPPTAEESPSWLAEVPPVGPRGERDEYGIHDFLSHWGEATR